MRSSIQQRRQTNGKKESGPLFGDVRSKVGFEMGRVFAENRTRLSTLARRRYPISLKTIEVWSVLGWMNTKSEPSILKLGAPSQPSAWGAELLTGAEGRKIIGIRSTEFFNQKRICSYRRRGHSMVRAPGKATALRILRPERVRKRKKRSTSFATPN